MSFMTSHNIVNATTNSIKKYTKGRTNFKELLYKMSSEQNKPVEMQSVNTTEELDFEKSAAWYNSPAVTSALGQALGTAGALGIVGAASAGINYVSNKLNNSEYEANLKQAIRLSPALARYDINELRSYMKMIANASPTVAKDPRLLANYLESMLDAEGHLNLGTFRELSSLENTVLQNKQLMNPARSEFYKGLGKGFGEGINQIGSNLSAFAK